MSEPFGVRITIGGTLKAADIPAFLEALKEDIYDLNEGPTEEEDLRTEAGVDISWQGTANWGNVETITEFCRGHDLSYAVDVDGNYESNPMTSYWVPGMDAEFTFTTDNNHEATLLAKDVQPLVMFMMALIKNGPNALPLLVNESGTIGDYVAEGLKDYKGMLKKLEEDLPKEFPSAPEIPPFIIKDVIRRRTI